MGTVRRQYSKDPFRLSAIKLLDLTSLRVYDTEGRIRFAIPASIRGTNSYTPVFRIAKDNALTLLVWRTKKIEETRSVIVHQNLAHIVQVDVSGEM